MGLKWMGKPVEDMDRDELLNVVHQLAKRLEIERMTKATAPKVRDYTRLELDYIAEQMGYR